MTERLQNKKKNAKSSKKEAGGDEKHVFLFTWPNHPFIMKYRTNTV